jgi:thiamine biosynthesis lipoprotein ApbE
MKRFLVILAMWLAALGSLPASAGTATDWTFTHENVMGTQLELQVRSDNESAARWAEQRILCEIDRLSKIFSRHDPQSELRRLQAAPRARTPISAELCEVLRASDEWRVASGGAFDPRVQILSDLWTACARRDRPPSDAELADARSILSRPAWRLDAADRTAERLSDCPLSLDGIAKGWIIERACAAALEPIQGVRGLLLNVGGDLRVCGDLTARIGLAPPWSDSESAEPFAQIEVRNRSVATGGRSQRGFSIGGRWYSHIFDPRTGQPAEDVAMATVVAEYGADADALDTIFNVLSPAERRRLATGLPGVEFLIARRDGAIERSPGWGAYEVSLPQSPIALVAAADNPKRAARPPWNKEFELIVNFEINQPEGAGRRYRRPYVAVWVEDETGMPVRTLTLWVSLGGAGPEKWLPDLKRWYRGDQARIELPGEKNDMVFTIARPTRPPGKYKVVWDGTDNHGKPLGGGAYTIFIEAAREHGTYQSMRLPVVLTDRPFERELKGNVELRSASIAYRRKSPAK